MKPGDVNRLTGCEGKQAHSQKFAQSLANRMRRHKDYPIAAYKCSACGSWHVGESAAFRHGADRNAAEYKKVKSQQKASSDRRPVPESAPNIQGIDRIIAHCDFEHIMAAKQLCADGIAYADYYSATGAERRSNPYRWRMARIKAWLRAYGQAPRDNSRPADDVKTDFANHAVNLLAPYLPVGKRSPTQRERGSYIDRRNMQNDKIN